MRVHSLLLPLFKLNTVDLSVRAYCVDLIRSAKLYNNDNCKLNSYMSYECKFLRQYFQRISVYG